MKNWMALGLLGPLFWVGCTVGEAFDVEAADNSGIEIKREGKVRVLDIDADSFVDGVASDPELQAAVANALGTRVSALEDRADLTQDGISNLGDRVTALEGRVTALEEWRNSVESRIVRLESPLVVSCQLAEELVWPPAVGQPGGVRFPIPAVACTASPAVLPTTYRQQIGGTDAFLFTAPRAGFYQIGLYVGILDIQNLGEIAEIPHFSASLFLMRSSQGQPCQGEQVFQWLQLGQGAMQLGGLQVVEAQAGERFAVCAEGGRDIFSKRSASNYVNISVREL